MDIIDSIIAEGASPSADNAQPQADATKPTEETKLPPENAEQEDAGKQQEEAPFPKKAINALSRRDKQIGQLRAERAALAAELDKLRGGQQQPQQANPTGNKAAGAPNEAEYKNYADYLEALQDWKLDQRMAKIQTDQQKTAQSAQEQTWISDRQEAVASQAQEFIAKHPETLAIVQEYADVIDSFPAHIERLFLEADNAPLAVINLAKEGKLEALASMSPAKAAMEIGRAQTQAYAPPKTKAPAPLPASRGSVAPSKSLDSMSGEELLAWVG